LSDLNGLSARVRNPFKYLKTPLAITRLAVTTYIRFPLSLRNVNDPLYERGINITHKTVRFWWNRFGPMCTAQTPKKRVANQNFSKRAWHLHEVFVKTNGELHYLCRAADHDGEVLEVYVTKRRNRTAA
tara:strand:- start:28695 stop:29081 length:387 start_codon:yes stop_codon:yes gene_type:complete